MTGPGLVSPGSPAPAEQARRWSSRYGSIATLGLVIALSMTAIIAASRRTSPTFDEIVLIAGGARGYETGRFDLAPDHPPLLQYVYGLPVFLSHPKYPDESGVDQAVIGTLDYRYLYARTFFWGMGNDAERLAALGRLPAAAIAAVLVLLVFGFVRSHWNARTATLAAALTAFLPDVLAHGGVAYNDLPLAAAFLGGIWAVDVAIRRPTVARGVLAGAAMALAISTKASGVIVVPVAVILLCLQAVTKGSDHDWWRRIAVAGLLATIAAYLVVALVYAGDWTLAGLRFALASKVHQVEAGHGAAAFLLGRRSTEGWWYFFPVAFVLKTSAGLHLLLLVSVYSLWRASRRSTRKWSEAPLRAPLTGIAVYSAVLLTSHLNIGFRYALPVLPLVTMVAAVGAAAFWTSSEARGWSRTAVAFAAGLAIAFPLSYFPNYLAFVSEYGPGRDRNYEVFVDSSLDWGQGLVQLHDFLAAHGNPLIVLSYFGSGVPEAYGIRYVPGPSYFPLHAPADPDTTDTPRFLVVSATNLQGAYFSADPFRRLRERVDPERVIAGSLLVYRWE